MYKMERTPGASGRYNCTMLCSGSNGNKPQPLSGAPPIGMRVKRGSRGRSDPGRVWGVPKYPFSSAAGGGRRKRSLPFCSDKRVINETVYEQYINEQRRFRQMRIAQIAPPWITIPPKSYGGTENVLYDLVEEFRAHGHD